jgi:hypothetical protein
MISAGNRRAGRAVQATKPLNCATSPIAVASQDDKNASKDAPSAKPGFDPKPVQLGGESLLERLLPHMKKIALVLIGIALILTVVFTIRHFKERGRQKDTAKFVKVLDVADRQIVPEGVTPDPKDPRAKEPTFKSSKERAQAVLDELNKQGTNAAGPVYKASLLVEVGKLDEAITEYKKATDAKGLDGVLARREGRRRSLEGSRRLARDVQVDAARRERTPRGLRCVSPGPNPRAPAEVGRGARRIRQGQVARRRWRTADDDR